MILWRKNYDKTISRYFSKNLGYIISVKRDDFIENPQTYIEKAYLLQNSIEQYIINEEIG